MRTLILNILKLTLIILPFLVLTNTSFAVTQKEVIEILSQPNSGGKYKSIKTGIKDIKACENASYNLQPIWIAAGKLFEIKWQILAAITEIESDFGCNMGPSSANAVGWTQFIPSTWERWGMDADGDGKADPHNAVDAIFSSARYLRVTGAPEDYEKAIFAYNHADWYVKDVLERSKKYGALKKGEFKKLKEITKAGQKIKKEITGLEEDYQKAQDLLKTRKSSLKKSEDKLSKIKSDLKKSENDFEKNKEKLNNITKDYIEFNQELSSSPELAENQEVDDQLLNYITESNNPSDAVLIYQVASDLVNTKTNKLLEVRKQSVKTSEIYQEVKELHKTQKEVTIKKFEDYTESKKLSKEVNTKLKTSKNKYKKYKKIEKQYMKYYLASTGNTSTLDESIYNNSDDQLIVRGEGELLTWPITGKITSPFSPNRCLSGICRPHEGLDIAISANTNVYSAGDGVVEWASVKGGYGNYICIAHSDKVSSCYAHLNSYAVKKGDKVKENELIAKSGCTGRCFGDHLHYEIRIEGKAVDPYNYMKR